MSATPTRGGVLPEEAPGKGVEDRWGLSAVSVPPSWVSWLAPREPARNANSQAQRENPKQNPGTYSLENFIC